MEAEIKELRPGETYTRIQYLNDKKIIDIVKRLEEDVVMLHKEKPVEGQSTSSKIIQTKNEMVFNP